jgi:acylphosphatase
VKDKDPKIAKRFLVKGRVQGVGYRYFTEHWAGLLGIVGNVKNLWDGNVEVYAIGNPAAIAEMRRQLYLGPRSAHVTAIEESDEAVDGRYNRFMIEESL